MLCGTCKRQIADDAVFCPHCDAPVEGAEECTDYTYEAFISYRHRKLDRSAAKRLQRFLEGFRIPKNLAQGRTEKRLGKLFRDEDELPTADSLPDLIQDALLRSRYLVVVCSPNAVESLWVQREVEMFASMHGRHRILLLLVEGEPEESFPPLLRHRVVVAPDGTESLVEEEPLAADFRAASRKKPNVEALRIAATLIGCSFDDLRQRMRLRRMRTIALAAGIVAVVAVSFGAFSLYQQAQIQANHRASQFHESELLAAEAEELLAQGDRYQAIQVALRALPASSSDDSRPFVPAASLVLQRALELYPSSGVWTSDYSLLLPSDNNYSVEDDGCLVTITSAEDAVVRTVALGEELYTIKKEDMLFSPNATYTTLNSLTEQNNYLVTSCGNTLTCFQASTGKRLWQKEVKGTAYRVRVGDDVMTALCTADPTSKTGARTNVSLVMYRLSDGKVLQSHALDDLDSGEWDLIGESDSGDTIVCGSDDRRLVTLDSSGAYHSTKVTADVVLDAVFSGDTLFVVSSVESRYLVSGSVTVEAFDSVLNRIWEHEDSVSELWDTEGQAQRGSVGISGVRAHDDGADDIVVSLGSDVVILDTETGAALNRTLFDAAILDCYTELDGVLIAVLSDGKMNIVTERNGKLYTVSEQMTTHNLTRAQILPISGVGVYVVGKSIAPAKIAVFHYGDSPVARAAAEKADWLPETAKIVADNNQVAMVDGGDVSILNPETLKPAFTVPRKSLPGSSADADLSVMFANADTAYAWAKAESGERDIVLYRISREGETGSVDATVAIDNAFAGKYRDDSVEGHLHIGIDGNLMWRADDRIVLLDGESLTVTGEVPASSGCGIDFICDGANTVLLCECADDYSSQVGRFRLVDKETGQDIMSDLDGYSYIVPLSLVADILSTDYYTNVATNSPLAFDKASDRVAISCSDGCVRVFNLADGSLVWESAEVSPHLAFMLFTASGDLLVQGEDGHCLLIAGEDGTIAGSTRISLPTLTKCVKDTGSFVYVTYQRTSSMSSGGIAMISVDRDSFGPLVDMPKGVAVDKHGVSYLADNYGYELYSLYPMDFDVVVAIATKLCEGHELTAAESALYQVEE